MGCYFEKSYKIKYLKYLFVFSVSFFILLYLQAFMVIPEQLFVINGQEYKCNFNAPVSASVSVSGNKHLLLINGKKVSNNSERISLLDTVTIKGNSLDYSKILLKMRLFGFLPFKRVAIDVVPNTQVIPCGNAVGIQIHTEGVLVVGTTRLKNKKGLYEEPYENTGIDKGDYLTAINNEKINSVDDIVEEMKMNKGERVVIKVKENNNQVYNAVLKPCLNADGSYKLGLWLRDSTAGIGTLTFYEPNSKKFGALGHGITDFDSGAIFDVREGEVCNSSIVSIRKGYNGFPGELKGVLVPEKGNGVVIKNTNCGVFGIINNPNNIIPENKLLNIGLRNQIKKGPAQIISNISGNSIDLYNIEIVKVFNQDNNTSKNMLIQVTDKRLIGTTGGIVQGMSGSPIIQNGRIIGAVTHVLVNDPKKGYGVFIENMLQKINESN